MGKRALLNIWLVVALAVLVWVVWQEPGHPPKPAAVKLTGLTPAAINKIVINNRHGTIKLDKQDGAWRLAEPVKVAANPVRIDSLLQVAEAESLSRFPAAGKDLAAFGLAKPAVSLRLDDSELSFGGVAPVDDRRYVRVGDTIHLIADRYMYDLMADAATWVSRDLVTKGKRVVALELPDAKLARGDKGEWMVTPADEKISQDAVQAVVKAWREAQALRVAPYDKRPAQGKVVIRLEGGQSPLQYEIITRKPELILARPEIGMQFYLDGDQAERLLTLGKPAAATATTDNN